MTDTKEVKIERKPFLVRLTPKCRLLLDQARKEQEKTTTALINESIKSHLGSN